MSSLTLLVIGLSFLISLPVQAKKLSDANHELGFFIGTWNCSGHYKSKINDKENVKNFKGEKVVFRPIFDGHWLEGDYYSDKMINRCVYAKNGTHFLLNCYGNFVGMISSRAEGWEKNKLIFKGKSYYQDYTSDEVKEFTKISKNEYHVFSTISNDKENYYTEFKAECLKKKID